jgi:hypothetical protein
MWLNDFHLDETLPWFLGRGEEERGMTSFLVLCMSLILGQRIPVLLWGNSVCTDGDLRIFCMSSIVYSELFIFFFPMQSPSPKKNPGTLSYVLLIFFSTRIRVRTPGTPIHPPSLPHPTAFHLVSHHASLTVYFHSLNT